MADRDWDGMIDEVEYYARELVAAREWGMNTKNLDKCLSQSRTALREAIAEVERERDALKSRLAEAEQELAHYRGIAFSHPWMEYPNRRGNEPR